MKSAGVFGLLLAFGFALGEHQDADYWRTEFVTDIATTNVYVTATPIDWVTTPIVTVTATPVPTCKPIDCQKPLVECQCKKGYHCEYEKPLGGPCDPCPALKCVPDCVKCDQTIPKCNCRPDQVCAYQEGSCFQCPFYYCLDVPINCVKCSSCPAVCDCDHPSQCIYHEQTCDSCPFYTCSWDPQCPEVAVTCDPACAADERCSVERDDADGCFKRKCVPIDCNQIEKSVLVDACKFCSKSEICKEGPNGTKRCVPKDEEPCLKCPPVDTGMTCPENTHLIVVPNECHRCGHARCDPNPCINCLIYPIQIECAADEDLVLHEPSCYNCGSYECVKKNNIPFNSTTCYDGIPGVEIVDHQPKETCSSKSCVICDNEASCEDVECPEGTKCSMIPRTCDQCPIIACVPIAPPNCLELAKCTATSCSVGEKCVEIPGTKDKCPVVKCVPIDDCLICPQVMPECNCESKEDCVLVKQSCLECSHYVCQKPIKCPRFKTCGDFECPGGRQCVDEPGDSLTCPVSTCLPEQCVKCEALLAECTEGCERDEICKIIAGTCDSCSTAECVKNLNCVNCPSDKPIEAYCQDEEYAVYDKGDCKKCPSFKCVKKPCVDCLERNIEAEDCPNCGKDEFCEITPRTCLTCAKGQCKSRCVQCDPRLTQCPHCEDGHVCAQIPGDCLNCPRAECQFKPCVSCDPLTMQCDCKPDEIGIFVPGTCYECPRCRCEKKPKEECQPPSISVAIPIADGTLGRACVKPNDVKDCPTTIPQCHCAKMSDCIYEHRTFDKCASYRCKDDCVKCPDEPPKCGCADESKCILQPRTCESCARYYCLGECTECNVLEPKCPCKNPMDCVLRRRTCLWGPYYECLPPSKKRI